MKGVKAYEEKAKIIDDTINVSGRYSFQNAGCESYLLPQRYDLPFGCSREDLLIQKWE